MTRVPETSPPESHTTPQTHARTLAHLGERALAEVDLQSLINEAVATLARMLGTDYSEFQELLADGQTLVLLAGTGWKDGYVGQATVSVAAGFQEGYTLGQQDAVRVDDPQSEHRFRQSPLHLDHAVVSGISVAVRGPERLYGVLGAHSTQRRVFEEEAVALLNGIAALLALAYERQRWQRLASAAEERLRVAADAGQMGTWDWDARAERISWSPQVEIMHGLTPGTFDGTVDAYLATVYPDDRPIVLGRIPPTLENELYTIEYRVISPQGHVRWVEARGRLTRTDKPSRCTACVWMLPSGSLRMRPIGNRKPGSGRLHNPQATQSLRPTAMVESRSGTTVRRAFSGTARTRSWAGH